MLVLPMWTRTLALALVAVSLPAGALAQPLEAADEAEVPEPPSSSDTISDVELVRWAANEVRIHEGRARTSQPPVPPDAYVGTGIVDPTAIPPENDALRIVAEIGGGTLGLLIGAGLGGLVVWGAVESTTDPVWRMVAIGAASTAGAFGVTGGVVLAAEATGGRGHFGHAFIGQLMGSAVALPLVMLGLANDLPAISAVAIGILPLAGAMFGYEISHVNREGAVRQVAFVTPTPDGGAMVGVAGEVF
jgi:hypothetical protein